MKQYLMKLTPLEAYFFGNEKSFKYPGCENATQTSNQYFIRSESLPSQTTLLGMLRYLLLPVKKNDFSAYSDEDKAINAATVGPASFNYEIKNQDFGLIKAISPLFLLEGESILVKTPMDHNLGEATYKPFSDYETMETPYGKKLFTKEYNAKIGLSSSYMSVKSGRIYNQNQIFSNNVRVGINRQNQQDGLFKKEYIRLAEGFSFGAYISLDEDAIIKDTTVFLGQGKSAFSVSFTEATDNIETDLRKLIRSDVVYVASDSFVEQKPYESALFSITQTKSYRAYTTNYGKIRKSSTLYKLICAGSILIPENIDETKKLFADENAERIGFNKIILGGKYV